MFLIKLDEIEIKEAKVIGWTWDETQRERESTRVWIFQVAVDDPNATNKSNTD
jgi:hypothetical protein